MSKITQNILLILLVLAFGVQIIISSPFLNADAKFDETIFEKDNVKPGDHIGLYREIQNKTDYPASGLTAKVDKNCTNTSFRNASEEFKDIFEISWVNPYVSALLLCGALESKDNLIRPWVNAKRHELVSLALKVNKIETEKGLSVPFADVSRIKPYYDDIATAYKYGMIQGMSSKKFAPEEDVKREEAIKILLNTAGFDAKQYKGTSYFTDTNPKSWSAPYIAFLKERNISTGFPDGSFQPWKAISRAEMFKIIVKIAQVERQWFPPMN